MSKLINEVKRVRMRQVIKSAVLFGVISFLAVSVVHSCCADEITSPAKVIITALTGEKDIQFLKPATTSWVKLQEDMVLNEGDRIRTGADSGVSIKYKDGAIIDFVKVSDLTVTQLRQIDNPDKKRNILNIKTGYMHGYFEKIAPYEESKFEIRTPTAVCEVLGTKIYIDAYLGTVYVTDGTLSIINIITAETYTVAAGNSITINTDGSTAGAQPYSSVSIESIKNTFKVLDIDVSG